MSYPLDTLPKEFTALTHTENNGLLPVVPKETIKELYSMAYSFYNNGKFREALNCFLFLVKANADIANYWNGLAASHKMLKNYREAIGAYALAALLDTEDPQTHMHAADCFFALNEGTQALNALHVAEQLAKGQEKYHQLLSRIAVLRTAWKEQQLEESNHGR